MFPLRDENPTLGTSAATFAIIALNAAAWIFVQGLGSEPALARSVCELGAIPGALLGKRLPTDAEWEHAAAGPDDTRYPWGNEAPSADEYCTKINVKTDKGEGCGTTRTAKVGSRPAGYYGLFDMAGNVHEWTGSLYESGSGARVVRGGSWQNDASSVRSSHREGALPDLRDASIGFRCAEGAVVAESQAR